MTACTDDERRLVAAALRGLTSNVYGLRKSYESEGFCILCEEQADYYQMCKVACGYLPPEHMHPCDYAELHDRLADLIDPDCGTEEVSTSQVPKCDREELLALAGELDRSLGWCEPDERGCVKVNVSRLLDVSRRIREACGERAS